MVTRTRTPLAVKSIIKKRRLAIATKITTALTQQQDDKVGVAEFLAAKKTQTVTRRFAPLCDTRNCTPCTCKAALAMNAEQLSWHLPCCLWLFRDSSGQYRPRAETHITGIGDRLRYPTPIFCAITKMGIVPTHEQELKRTNFN